MFLSFVLVLLISLTIQTSVSSSDIHVIKNGTKPAFCGDLECPEYKVLESNTNFETRKYHKSEWIAVNTSTPFESKFTENQLFVELLKYNQGGNEKGQNVHIEVPILIEILPANPIQPFGFTNVTMHFMIPFELQPRAPKPTVPSVYIKKMGEMVMFVKNYTGMDQEFLRQQVLAELHTSLQMAGKSFDSSTYYVALYTSPYKTQMGYNEIWVPEKNSY